MAVIHPFLLYCLEHSDNKSALDWLLDGGGGYVRHYATPATAVALVRFCSIYSYKWRATVGIQDTQGELAGTVS